MVPVVKHILILCPCLCTYNLCTLQTTSSHYIPPCNICPGRLWFRSQRRINLRWMLRAVRTETGSAGLLARRSRWCAPSGMMTATADFERLYSTPPLDQGSSRPLLRKTASNTATWTALFCNRGKPSWQINKLSSLVITGGLRTVPETCCLFIRMTADYWDTECPGEQRTCS